MDVFIHEEYVKKRKELKQRKQLQLQTQMEKALTRSNSDVISPRTGGGGGGGGGGAIHSPTTPTPPVSSSSSVASPPSPVAGDTAPLAGHLFDHLKPY